MGKRVTKTTMVNELVKQLAEEKTKEYEKNRGAFKSKESRDSFKSNLEKQLTMGIVGGQK